MLDETKKKSLVIADLRQPTCLHSTQDLQAAAMLGSNWMCKKKLQSKGLAIKKLHSPKAWHIHTVPKCMHAIMLHTKLYQRYGLRKATSSDIIF